MSSSIVSITPHGSDSSQVLVDSGYADSLNRFMQSKHIFVHPPQEAVSRTVHVDADDRRVVETEPLDMTFMASATPKQLEPIVAEWLSTLAG